jgi:hypothetical protein
VFNHRKRDPSVSCATALTPAGSESSTYFLNPNPYKLCAITISLPPCHHPSSSLQHNGATGSLQTRCVSWRRYAVMYLELLTQVPHRPLHRYIRFKPVTLASAGIRCTSRMCGSVAGMGAGQKPCHEPREALMDFKSPATKSHSDDREKETFEARGCRKVTTGITGLWQSSVHSDVAF